MIYNKDPKEDLYIGIPGYISDNTKLDTTSGYTSISYSKNPLFFAVRLEISKDIRSSLVTRLQTSYLRSYVLYREYYRRTESGLNLIIKVKESKILILN